MLLLVKKRLDEMIADNDIKTQMKGKRLAVTRVEMVNVFEQGGQDKWSCYDGIQNEDETDADCGGSCLNACTLSKQCSTQSDCVDGLYCTKGKCIDRSLSLRRGSSVDWKQVVVTSIVIVGIIVVMVCIIVFGGILYQKAGCCDPASCVDP